MARQSESDRLASQAQSAAERRDELFLSSMALLDGLYTDLSDAITAAAPGAARAVGKRQGITFQIGPAQLELVPATKTSPSPWDWEAPSFDVFAHAGISLRIPMDRYQFEGRSHSLWYCDAFEKGRYEWVELAFMMSPLSPRNTPMRPFMANPGQEAAKALWMGMAEYQLAWPLETVDSENFIDRWSSWLADAVLGRLSAPSSMPEKPTPRNWRP